MIRSTNALLALIWLTTGALMIALWMFRDNWVGLLFGILAIAYGIVWIQVTRTGRLLQWQPDSEANNIAEAEIDGNLRGVVINGVPLEDLFDVYEKVTGKHMNDTRSADCSF